MLPTELLVVQRWKDNIRPKYSKLDERSISIANAVIKAYVENTNLKRGEIREKVSELEEAYADYRFIRGLATIFERVCTFSSKASIEPLTARHMLFAEASRRGYPTSYEERNSIVEYVASNLKVSIEQLEDSMYADLDSEMVLEYAPSMSPLDLLKNYNLSLTQSLLFHSTEMMFIASKNWQRIFRAIKYYGLMYTAERKDENFIVRLSGPISLFKLTRRYGTAMAKVIPEILKGKPWRIEAKILRMNRLLNFVLESDKHGWLFPEMVVEEKYDSMVEAEFANQFKSLGTVWTLVREAEPVEAGASIMIPDFVFRFGKTYVPMEIVGFWTHEYLKRKLEKLAEIRCSPFILAVDEELACDKLSQIASSPNIHLIYYKGKIQVKDVLSILKPMAEAELNTQASKVELHIKKSITTIREIAEELGVATETVRRAMNKIDTHLLVGEMIIEKALIGEVKKTLEDVIKEETQLPKVLEALRPYNLPDPITMITYCGYTIKWQGLIIERALVKKEGD